LKELFTDGYRASKKDSQIRLAYFASLAARGDIVVVGLFTFLWTSRFAIDNGMTIEQGYAITGTIVAPLA
jgi:hypothetical protein